MSDDNPFIEALSRTITYRPCYPGRPFADIEAARRWVGDFLHWHNHERLDSAIGFVTSHDRHTSRDTGILVRRREFHAHAYEAHPERRTGIPRKWARPTIGRLNPECNVRLPSKNGSQAV